MYIKKLTSTTPVRKIRLNLLLLIGAIFVSLFFAELFLRYLSPEQYYVWPPNLSMKLDPKPEYLPGISGATYFKTNSIGLRSNELLPTHNLRILAIGASSTECTYLDDSETWTNILEKTLSIQRGESVWVGNAGVSGHTIKNHILMLQLLPLDKMKITTMLFLIGANDLSYALSQKDSLDGEALLNNKTPQELLNETFRGSEFIERNAGFINNLRIIKLVDKIIFSKNNQQQETYLDNSGSTTQKWRDHRKQATKIYEALPDIKISLDEFKINVLTLLDIAHSKSITSILITHPSLWKENMDNHTESLLWMGGVGLFQIKTGLPYYSSGVLAKGMKLFNSTLLDVCREKKIQCIDLDKKIPKSAEVFYDDVHFTEHGAQLVAQEISNSMRNFSTKVLKE